MGITFLIGYSGGKINEIAWNAVDLLASFLSLKKRTLIFSKRFSSNFLAQVSFLQGLFLEGPLS